MADVPFPEPTTARASRADVLVGYLDYFRAVVLDKVGGLTDERVRGSVLPSAAAR